MRVYNWATIVIAESAMLQWLNLSSVGEFISFNIFIRRHGNAWSTIWIAFVTMMNIIALSLWFSSSRVVLTIHSAAIKSYCTQLQNFIYKNIARKTEYPSQISNSSSKLMIVGIRYKIPPATTAAHYKRSPIPTTNFSKMERKQPHLIWNFCTHFLSFPAGV